MINAEVLNVVTRYQFKTYKMQFAGVVFTKRIGNVWYSEEQECLMFEATTRTNRVDCPNDYIEEFSKYVDAQAFCSHVATGIWTEVND